MWFVRGLCVACVPVVFCVGSVQFLHCLCVPFVLLLVGCCVGFLFCFLYGFRCVSMYVLRVWVCGFVCLIMCLVGFLFGFNTVTGLLRCCFCVVFVWLAD